MVLFYILIRGKINMLSSSEINESLFPAKNIDGNEDFGIDINYGGFLLSWIIDHAHNLNGMYFYAMLKNDGGIKHMLEVDSTSRCTLGFFSWGPYVFSSGWQNRIQSYLKSKYGCFYPLAIGPVNQIIFVLE